MKGSRGEVNGAQWNKCGETDELCADVKAHKKDTHERVHPAYSCTQAYTKEKGRPFNHAQSDCININSVAGGGSGKFRGARL